MRLAPPPLHAFREQLARLPLTARPPSRNAVRIALVAAGVYAATWIAAMAAALTMLR